MLLDALRSCPSLASMDCLFKQRMLEETTAVVCASSLSDSRAHSTEFRATLSQNYCVIAFVESPRALAVWSQCGEWVWGARRYDHMGNDLFAHRLPACSACYPQYCPLPTGTPSWCFAHFEPEGILPTQASVVTTWIGMHYGLVLQHHKDLQGLRYVKNFWIVESMVLIVLGTGIHFAGWKINKQLWSPYSAYMFLFAVHSFNRMHGPICRTVNRVHVPNFSTVNRVQATLDSMLYRVYCMSIRAQYPRIPHPM
eukprot:m.1411877 g.1411877  ORF g.1411877 m.1411877 type:complete len:254 (-) comp25028_c0_seq52:3103-3864(-)